MSRLRSGAAVTAVLAALAVASFAAAAPGSPFVSTCAGAGPNHAALVIEHGDGSAVSRCVAFDTPTISGDRLLAAAGVPWSGQTFGGFGVAVCAVDAEPSRYGSCPGADRYWAVFEASGGAWELSPVGLSSMTVADGDALGLRYVPTSGTPEPPASAIAVCPGTAEATAGAIAASPSGAALTAALTAAAERGAPGRDGFDFGLASAVLVGAGLAGLAVFRLGAGRRRTT
jgi:hypothetical protein